MQPLLGYQSLLRWADPEDPNPRLDIEEEPSQSYPSQEPTPFPAMEADRNAHTYEREDALGDERNRGRSRKSRSQGSSAPLQ